MRAKKESDKRNSHDSTDTAPNNRKSVPSQTLIDPLSTLATPSAHLQNIAHPVDTDETNSETPEQQANLSVQKTHVGTVPVQEAESAHSNKSLESVIAIIDRIMNAVKQDSAAKIWTIEIALDESNSFNLELQHHGKGEWSLAVDQDQRRNQQQEMLTTENALDGLEQFTEALRSELAKNRPQVTILTSSVS